MTNSNYIGRLTSDAVAETGSSNQSIMLDASKYSDAELLSQFIGGNKDTRIAKAESMLLEYGNLPGIAKCYANRFHMIRPSDISACEKFMAALEVTKRCVESTGRSCDVLSSPQHVRDYLATFFIGKEAEAFGVLCLDNRHRVIGSGYTELFQGTIDGAAVYPRVVVQHCLSVNCAAVIFAHNHPSGISEPSDTDVRLTRKLVDALALIDIRVLDHLIIGDGVQTSLAERNLM